MALLIIMTKTPPQMKTYKLIIVSSTVTSLLTDIVICFLFDPIPLFPEVACYSKTWIANISEDANYILLCISMVMLQLTLSNTLVAFIYRRNSLGTLSKKCLIFSNCGLKYTLSAAYLFSLVPVVVVLIKGYRPRSQMRKVVEKTPELKLLEDYGSYLAADKNDSYILIFQAIWLSSAFAIVTLCTMLASRIITQLHERRQSMSLRSLQLHRRLTIQLTVQILIPVATTLIPLLVLFCTRYTEVLFGAEFWNLVISQTVALNSPLNTIATMLATRHYLTAFAQPFKHVANKLLRAKPYPAMHVLSRLEERHTYPTRIA
ncbi:hypothetical protein Y032_0330g2700 [Ancylostoma ceylanicum]|nr:hypothetical protein Y032_0330g2700 [Ancylostoma ceylanicum]